MKLRSTLFFAAASLSASALAPVVVTTSAFFATSSISAQATGEIISLNFGRNDRDSATVDGNESGTAGFATYVDSEGTSVGVNSGGWTNTVGPNGTATNIKNHDGNAIDGATVTWSNSSGVWGINHPALNTTEGAIQSSYLDQGGTSKWNIAIDSTFLVCDVYVYLSGDATGTYAPINVNGTSYAGGTDQLSSGTNGWGDRSTGASEKQVLGTNALKVTDQAGNISLSNVTGAGGRGTLSGVQVVNTYEGTTYKATLDGGNSTWNNVAFNNPWANSKSTVDAGGKLTSTGGAYADFTLTSNTTLQTTAEIITDAIYVSGAGRTLTLNGGLTLSGTAVLRTGKDTTLALNLGGLEFAANVTGATLAGAGTLAITDFFADAAYAKLKNGSSWGGTIQYKENVTLVNAEYLQTAGIRIFEKGLTTTKIARFTGGTTIVNGALSMGRATLSNAFTANEAATITDLTWVEAGGNTVTFKKAAKLSDLTIANGKLVFEGVTTLGNVVGNGGFIDFGTAGTTLKSFATTNNWSSTVLSGKATIATGDETNKGKINITGVGATLTLNDSAEIKVEGAYTASLVNSTDGASLKLGNNAILSVDSMNDNWGLTATLGENAIVDVRGQLSISPNNIRTFSGAAGSVINANSFRIGNFGRYTLDGLRLNIGDGGIANSDTTSPVSLTFKNATLGALADVWASTRALIFQGDNKVDTTKLTRDDMGRTTATTSGATITLANIDLTGGSSFVVSGLGKLVLNGNISMAANADTSVLALESGALEFGENARFVLTGSGSDLNGQTLKLVTLGAGATLTAGVLDRSDFTWNGVALSARTVVDMTHFATDGTVSFSGNAWDLIWNGGAAGTWNTSPDNKNWTNSVDGLESEFAAQDNATFNTAGNVVVTLGAGIVAGKIAITDGNISFAGTGNVRAVFGTTVSGAGVLTLGAGGAQSSSLRGSLTIENGGKVFLTGIEATGHSGGDTAINVLHIYEGGELIIDTTGNQSFNMSAGGVNLRGGKISGVVGATFDLFNGRHGINTLASETTSEISVDIGLRTGGNGTFNIQDGGAEIDLLISGALTNKGAYTLTLNKTGLGTLKLTGNNAPWTTNGTISQGTLIAASATALGTGAIKIENGATLVLDNAGFNSTVNRLNGAGTIEKIGTGSVTLGGSMAHSGNITISEGTVILTGQRELGNVASKVIIADGATLDISAAGARLFGGHNSNARVTVQGTLKLRESNWGDTGSLGKLSHGDGGVTLDGGELVFTMGQSTRRQFIVSANGGRVSIEGAQTMTFNGADAVGSFATNAGGTLQLGGGGGSTIQFLNEGANNAKITGVGSVEKVGAGTVIFNETNTYSGGTKVSEGTLQIAKADALGTGLTTLAGGTLAGIVTETTTGGVQVRTGVTFGAGKEILVTGTESTLSGLNFNGGMLSFSDINSILNLGEDMTFTSGTIDFSRINFTVDAFSMVVFQGNNVSQTIADALNGNMTSGGTFRLENGTIVFEAAETLRYLVWNNEFAGREWSTSLFSGKEFKAGQRVLFSSVEGLESVNITQGVSSDYVLVDAGATGSYEFLNSGNLTATEIRVQSGSLLLNRVDPGIKAIKIDGGASLVLKSDNSGFDSITLATGGELVLKSNTAFRDAGNKNTGGAILGSGTIVIDLEDNRTSLGMLNNLALALSNLADHMFTGTILTTRGTLDIDGDRGGKLLETTLAVEDGGRILLSTTVSSMNPKSLGKELKLAGHGLAGAAAGSADAAALAIVGSGKGWDPQVTLTGAATIYVNGSLSQNLEKFNAHGNTLTKTGTGSLVLGNNPSGLKDLVIESGQVRINNTNGTKNLGLVTLAKGAILGQFSGAVQRAGQHISIDELFLKGDAATIGQTGGGHSGSWLIGNLSLGAGATSSTLVLDARQQAEQVTLFEFGKGSTDVGNFTGTIELNQSQSSGARGAAIILSHGDIAKNAVISLNQVASADGVNRLWLGINADNVTIAGLSSNAGIGAKAVVFSGSIEAGSIVRTPKFLDAKLRTLTIDTAAGDSFTFHGNIQNNLNLVKTGAGTQVLTGASTAFDGSVSVQGGMLELKNQDALGKATSVSIDAGAVLSINETTSDTGKVFAFDKNLSGNGTLRAGGWSKVVFSGNLGVANVEVTEGVVFRLSTENASLAGTLHVRSGAEDDAIAGDPSGLNKNSTFETDFNLTVNGLSGGGMIKTSAEAAETRTLTLAGTGAGAGNAFTGTIRDLNITNTGTGHELKDVKWSGKDDGSAYTGTVSIASGTLTMGGANTGFAGTIQMDGGAIAGTLELNGGKLTASVSGATVIDNLTLGGGTVEFTRLDSQGNFSQRQWYSSTTLSINSTNTTVWDFVDILTPATVAGHIPYVLFAFEELFVDGTKTILADGSSQQDLISALGGNITLGGEYAVSGFEGLMFTSGFNQDTKKHEIRAHSSALAQNIYWNSNDGGWIQENAWANGATGAPTSFTTGSSVELKDLGDTVARTITINGQIRPADITVTGGEYILDLAEGAVAGSGISGENTKLLVTGGTLTVNLDNTFGGGTKILAAGTVNVGADKALGTGAVEIGGALNFKKDGDITFGNALSNYTSTDGTETAAGTITYAGDDTLTLIGDRSAFTGKLDIKSGTVVLANGTGDESFSEIAIAGNAILSAISGEATEGKDFWNSVITMSTLTLDQLTGTGTLRVNSRMENVDKNFFTLNLAGSAFTGTVELNKLDLALAADDNFAGVVASNLGNASLIRLANDASLNFFNRSQTFSKNIDVSNSNGALRVFGRNTGVTITGTLTGLGTLTVKDGGTISFTNNIALGGLVVDGTSQADATSMASFSGASFVVTGDVSLASKVTNLNATTTTIGGNLTASGGTVNVSGTTTIQGNLIASGTNGNISNLNVSGGLVVNGDLIRGESTTSGRTMTVGNAASVTVRGNASFADNEILTLGENASFTTGSLTTDVWGFAATLGANARLSAQNIALGANATLTGAGASSRLEIGNDAGTGRLTGTEITLGGVTLAGRQTGVQKWANWTSATNVKLNGGKTWIETTGDDQTITLTGQISDAAGAAAGTSVLEKTGAGTLVLGQANLNTGGTTVSAGALEYSIAQDNYNFAQGSNAAGATAGLTIADGTSLKFTSTAANDKVINLGSATIGFGGERDTAGAANLILGADTKLNVSSDTALNGHIVLTNERGGMLNFTGDKTLAGSLTLKSENRIGVHVGVDTGATLSLNDLTFTGDSASTIDGAGTLALGGTITVENRVANSIATGTLALTGNSTINLAQGANFTISSGAISANGNWLTKTGLGTLTFNTDAILGFDGSFGATGGTVNLGGGTLNISGTNGFELGNATLAGSLDLIGTDLDNRVSATMGGGSRITGDLHIENTELTFTGRVDGIQSLNWEGGNSILLSQEFRASLSGSITLMTFQNGFDANGTAFTENTDFGDIVETAGGFLGRDVEVGYSEKDGVKSINIVVTGALQWNDSVAAWVQDDPNSAQWDHVTKGGFVEKGTHFMGGDYVEFRKAGAIRIDGTNNNGTVNTTGMVFNLGAGTGALDDPDNRFVISARQDANGNIVQSTIASTPGEGDEGLTILSGNVVIESAVRNLLSSTNIFGGSLTVSHGQSLGGEVVLGGANGPAATLVFLNVKANANDANFQAITVGNTLKIGNNGAVIQVSEKDGTVTINTALEKVSDEVVAGLTKTGAGTLNIQRNSNLDNLSVAAGTLNLAGENNPLNVKNAIIATDATLNVAATAGANGANTSFGALEVGGTLAIGDNSAGAFRADQILGFGGSVSGTLFIGGGTGFDMENLDGSITRVNGTALGGNLTLTGSIESYGTADAALHKFEAGILTLTAADAGKFQLGADFVHHEGNVNFTNGVNATGTYSITGQNTQINIANTGNGSNTFNGFSVGENGNVTFNLGKGTAGADNALVFENADNTFSAAAGSSVSFFADDATEANNVHFVRINNGAENVEVNNLRVGGLNIGGGVVHLEVEGGLDANMIRLGAASSLKLGANGTANVLVLEENENFASKLDLTGGRTMTLTNTAGFAVLQGSGTLEVVGGTLSVNGENYSDGGRPTIVLNNATFNFDVLADGIDGQGTRVYSTLGGIETFDGATGIVSKTGEGTLVLFDSSGDLTFNGDIALREGATELHSRVSLANVTIEQGASLRFYGTASTTGVGEGKLANVLSGTGALEIGGMLDFNRTFDFNGTLSAGTAVGAEGGVIQAGGALNDWLANAAGRELIVQNGGWIFGSDEEANVRISSVSLKNTAEGADFGSLSGGDGIRETGFTVERVLADAGMTLQLSNAGTLGALIFDAENTANSLRVLGQWTINEASTNLASVTVGASAGLRVAHRGALGTAEITLGDRASLEFRVGGAYGNEMSFGDTASVSAIGSGAVSLTGTIVNANTAQFTRFSAGSMQVDAGGVAESGTLQLSEDVLGLTGVKIFSTTTVDSRLALNVTTNRTLTGEFSALDGAGTFEKTGTGTLNVERNVGAIGSFAVSAGTVTFSSGSALAHAGEEGSVGTLSVANGATLNVTGSNLGGFTLTGAGNASLNSKVDFANVVNAENIALKTGTTILAVAGDVSGSTLNFEHAGASLNLSGAGAVVESTTFSGETVTFVNSGTGTQTYAGSNSFDASTKKLVLSAERVGNSGGTVNTAFSGSLEKTGDGTWTVTNYTYGANVDETLDIKAGTLVWQNASFGPNAESISLGNSQTVLRIEGLAAGAGTTLRGTINGSGRLEIFNTQGVVLDTTASDTATWGLKVSGGSTVTINKALPGSLEVLDSKTVATISLAADADADTAAMTMDNQLVVGSGATLNKDGVGTLVIGNDNSTRQNTISGNINVQDGVLAQNAKMIWNSGSTLAISTDATFRVEMEADKDGGHNTAKLSGTGAVEIKTTETSGYSLTGDLSGFAGTVSVAEGARLNLDTNQLFGAGVQDVAVSGTLGLMHVAGGVLNGLSGKGSVEIDADSNNGGFYKAIYTSAESSNAFEGSFDVKSGALSVTTSQLADPDVKWNINVGGSKTAQYGEAGAIAGLISGAFLRTGNDGVKAIDVAGVLSSNKITLAENSGLIFAGSNGFYANSDFGSTGVNQLFVLEKGTTLSLANGASVLGDLFIASDATLIVNGEALTSNRNIFAITEGSIYSIEGNLTLNGKMIFNVSDAMLNGTLLSVGGNTVIDAGGSGKAVIELDITEVSEELASQDLVILNGYTGTANLDDILTVEAAGAKVEVSRDGNGNIVLVTAANSYSAPSGLSALFDTIKNAQTSDLWTYLKSDRADHETMDKKLVALSPVSFGSLVEMQSGFASLENDLLRERLEQRRYERRFASDHSVDFKPFVNILGSSRDGSGNGTDSSNYDISHTGVLGGYDVAISDNTIFGLSIGVDWAKSDLKNGGGKHEADSSRFGVYGMSLFGNTYFGYGLSGGGSSMKTKRNSGFNGESLRGETDGNDVNASLLFGAGWTLSKTSGIDIAPYVGLDLGYARAKAFTEEGGAETALDVEKMERWSLRGKIGATLNWRATDRLRVGIDASFAHEFLDSDMEIDAKFASGSLAGHQFASTAYLMDENTFQIGPRVDYRIDDTWSVSAAYSFETDMNDTMTHSANVGFRARF